jgi:hypothetical protein
MSLSHHDPQDEEEDVDEENQEDVEEDELPWWYNV